MGIWSSFKSGLDAVFHIRPKKWVSWDFVADNTKKNIDVVKSVFSIEAPKRRENFTQAMHRHGITQHEVEKIRKRYLLFSYFFLTLGLGILFYALQGLYEGRFGQFFGSFCLTMFIFSMSFRYNFWAFQIKMKKLGCTFAQWWADICGSTKQS